MEVSVRDEGSIRRTIVLSGMLAGVLVERDEPLELFCIYAIRALVFLSIFSSIPKALELLLDKEPTKS